MVQVHPDPNAPALLAQRYGTLDGDTFTPAPGMTDAEYARTRVQSHGRTWQLVQVTAEVAAHGTTGQATVGGVEDDRPLSCLAATLQAKEAAEEDARAWAVLGL